LRKLRGAS